MKKAFIPEKRFREFANSGSWEIKKLSEVYSFKTTNSFSREKLNYNIGDIKNIHYGDIHMKFSILFDITKEKVPYVNREISIDNINPECYCEEGDIIFADASEDLEDVGKSIEIVNLDNEKLLSGLHTLLARQIDNILVVGFGGYLFSSTGIRNQIKNEAQGAKVLGISARRISNILIYFPKSKAEQQKIAECLTSLDELIKINSEKLTALKDYKKGLLQKMFPAEGKNVPELRFPEFINNGDWEERTIGNQCNSFSGGTPFTSRKEFYGGEIPFIRSAEINKEETELFLTQEGLDNSSAKLVFKEDVLVALYGANSGDVAISKINGAINQAVLCLRSKENNSFIYHFLSSKKDQIISTYIQGGQGNLSGEIVKSIMLSFPKKEEQQKIAEFLSGLDESIKSQTEKIETLKCSKKGIMQLLFPVLND